MFGGHVQAEPAQLVAMAYYEAMKDHDFYRALGLFSESMFAEKSRSEWEATLSGYASKFGAPQGLKLFIRSVGHKGGGISYTLTYKVRYLGFTSREKFAFHRESAGDPLKITALDIQSKEI
jgi:hypothetical protein